MKAMADVIDLAINEHLWDGGSQNRENNYSCIAVYEACRADNFPKIKIDCFMEQLGCPTLCGIQFFEFEEGPKRQRARALWLTWASMIAREEGL